MLEEATVRAHLGCKICPGSVVSGRFGDTNVPAIVAVSQTLDKLVVHSPLGVASGELLQDPQAGGDSLQLASQANEYVVIKDVIKSVSVQYLRTRSQDYQDASRQTTGSLLFMNDAPEVGADSSNQTNQGLLLVGCSRSLMVYDVVGQVNLLDFSTSASVDAIGSEDAGSPGSCLSVCAGPRTLSAVKLELSSNQGVRTCGAEVFCERNLDYQVKCMARGHLLGLDLLICGSLERGIFVHRLDMFELDIQPSKLCLKQSAPVNCLCPMYTLMGGGSGPQVEQVEDSLPALLAEAREHGKGHKQQDSRSAEQMNYFAYGLENGTIGVYYLFMGGGGGGDAPVLRGESLWRERGKQVPVSMHMYDMNGDGLEELVVAYRNSRLEVRSPFTGQLLAATNRCFGRHSSELAGLQVLDYHDNGRPMLLACSSGGHLHGYLPPSGVSRPRVPLRGYSIAEGPHPASPLTDLAPSWTGVLAVGAEEEQKEQQQQLLQVSQVVHIESGRADHVRPQASEARQNPDYLLRLGALLKERSELDRRAAQLYRKRFAADHGSDALVQHRPTKSRLRLTIVVGGAAASFIRLEEEEPRLLEADGHLLIGGGGVVAGAADRSQVVVVPLRARDLSTCEASELKLSIFFAAPEDSGRGIEQHRVLIRRIQVPRQATLVPDPRRQPPPDWAPKLRLNCSVRLAAQQILDWLRDRLLCFQFGCLVVVGSEHPAGGQLANSLDPQGGFQINLVEAGEPGDGSPAAESNYAGRAMRIALRAAGSESERAPGHLSLECDSAGAPCLELLRWLLIDRLQAAEEEEAAAAAAADAGALTWEAHLEPIRGELARRAEEASQLADSEHRLRSELYELAQNSASLMQQLALANQLNEFSTSRELLNELFIMLNEAQNAARAQALTCKARRKLEEQSERLSSQVADFLAAN